MSPVTRGLVRAALPLAFPLYKPLENYNVCAAQEIKRNVGIPVIVVGGIRKLADIQRILGTGQADYVAMSRAFIIEPDIVHRFRDQGQRASECISCCYCFVCMEAMPAECHYGVLPDYVSRYPGLPGNEVNLAV
jgi:2,4-dienoyl-CoA reductase-like NADH-dependent reductase (Old Yellow Enzyme family)